MLRNRSRPKLPEAVPGQLPRVSLEADQKLSQSRLRSMAAWAGSVADPCHGKKHLEPPEAAGTASTPSASRNDTITKGTTP